MTILTSLGLHTPSALPYCVSEKLLPENPSPTSYQWSLTPSIPDEELLVTGSAAIWSQGGIIRRIFRFDVEKEPVIQACFTWFATDESIQNAKAEARRQERKEQAKREEERRKKGFSEKKKSYGAQLGTFPNRRPATARKASHRMGVLEEESGSDTETESSDKDGENARRRALVVFLKNQAHVFYLEGTSYVIHLPFEIQYALAAPNGILIQRKLPERGVPTDAKDFPRLFTLTDPLTEVGLVVASQDHPLSSSDEIIYISEPSSDEDESKQQFLFAVTRNLEDGCITVWNAHYTSRDPISSVTNKRTPSASGTATARRRSSFGPGTGATTPAPPNPSMISAGESIQLDFGTEKEKSSNRRVSSLVARADLSGPMDRMAFNDMASAASSFQQPPQDDLLNELNHGDSIMGGTAPYDGQQLRTEINLIKLHDFPIGKMDGELRPGELPRVFVMPIPKSSAAALDDGGRMMMYYVNTVASEVLALTLQLPGPIPGIYSKKKTSRRPTLVQTRHISALDAILVSDGDIHRILLATVSNGLILEAPWSSPLPVVLPVLHRSDVHQVGQRARQKRDFARTPSTTPKQILRLKHTESNGKVTIVDEKSDFHRISFQIQPREHFVRQALECVKYVLPDERGGEVVSVAMLKILQKNLGVKSWKNDKDNRIDEWTAFVVAIFSIAVGYMPSRPKTANRAKTHKRMSSTGVGNWDDFLLEDDEVGPQAEYLRSSPWEWLVEEQEERDEASKSPQIQFSTLGSGTNTMKNGFYINCIKSAKIFMGSKGGQAIAGSLPAQSPDPEVRRTSFAMLLVGLHLLREEWKLDISMELNVRHLTPVLVQMSLWLAWRGWAEVYLAEDIEVESWEFDDSRLDSINIPQPQFQQPSIYNWLVDSLESKTVPAFLTLHDIIAPGPSVSASYLVPLTPRTRMIQELYSLIMDKTKSHEDVVARMDKMKITSPMLERFPEGIAVPLYEAISRTMETPPTTWGDTTLDLVGRKDLKMLVGRTRSGRRDFNKYGNVSSYEAGRDVHSITASIQDTETIGPFDGNSEIDRTIITKLIFKDDVRWKEACALLQSTKPIPVKSIPEPEWTEHETLERQQELAIHVALRTLAVPSGRGLLYFSARIPLLTEKFPTPGFNLTCVMRPTGVTVSADKTNYTEEKVAWAFFHSGVAAGLSISKDASEIDTSWIVYNKPSELSNRHAGFLMALGLNGHLKSIAKWHAFNYLTPKHTMTSIGLLLGLSASYIGTMDSTITKLLSVHVTRLLPMGSAELNLSGLTQTAGIMGIGILYYNTQHRRMSEVMLSEIEHMDAKDPNLPEDTLRDEGYRLSAGFALGFINLAAGKSLAGLHDMNILERLINIAAGPKNVAEVHVRDKATAGATIALAMIYMKSMDESLAKKIDIPETMHMFDYIRPDLFLLRTVAKHLIMWDDIKGSMAWVRAGFKPFLQHQWKLDKIILLDSSYLPLLNLAAGLCFAVALRFAGSGDEEARDTLLYYLDQFTRLCNLPANNHDAKLTRATARNCQDLLALSAATVMAGTGDLPVFRRLRRQHGKVDSEIPFGSHLAGHLAIGILFMAGGTHTFSTSNLAVGSLLLSLYPLFPNTILDNRCHLQAFRHFWVMAAEPRCLVVRDVDTNRPTVVLVVITLTDGKELRKTAPCLLPEFHDVVTVRTESQEYWTSTLDFANNKSHLTSFQRSGTMYVQPRPPQFISSSLYVNTLLSLSSQETLTTTGLEWLLRLRTFVNTLDAAERGTVMPNARDMGNLSAVETGVDGKMVMERAGRRGNADRLRGLKVLFAFVEGRRERGLGVRFLREEAVERLRAGVWTGFN